MAQVIPDSHRIGRALPNGAALADVRHQRAWVNIDSRIPVPLVGSGYAAETAPHPENTAGVVRRCAVLQTFQQQIGEIASVDAPAEHHLAIIVHAAGQQRLLFGPAQGRQQQGCQNGDDGDDHQQLDEGKTGVAGVRGTGSGETPAGIACASLIHVSATFRFFDSAADIEWASLNIIPCQPMA